MATLGTDKPKRSAEGTVNVNGLSVPRHRWQGNTHRPAQVRSRSPPEHHLRFLEPWIPFTCLFMV
jgi:hypothetical protein